MIKFDPILGKLRVKDSTTETDPIAMAYLDQSVKTTGTPLFGGTTSGIPYSEVNDEATTNLVTNPSFEVDTAGWTGILGTETITRDTTAGNFYFGVAGLKVVTAAGVTGGGVQVTVNVSPNTVYAVSWWSKGGDYPIYWALVGDSSGATNYANTHDQGFTSIWTRCSGTKTTNGSDTTLTLKAYVGWDNTNAQTFYIDAVQIEAKAYPTSYCDGSMGTGYAWTGTVHASTSTRTAGWHYFNPSQRIVFDTSGNMQIPTGIFVGYKQLSTGYAKLTTNALTFTYGQGGASWAGGISFSGTTLYVGTGGNSTIIGTTSSNYDMSVKTGAGKLTLSAESTGYIYVKPKGDTDDYFEFTTLSNVPTLLTVGACDLALGGTAEAVRIQNTTGNVGIGTTSFGTSATKTFGIGTGTAPSAHVDDEIQVFSVDSADATATLGLFLEQAVEAVGLSVADNKVKVNINGTAYYLLLTAV